WFFDRVTHGRPIPLPNQGLYITQLGHVADLAAAMVATLGNPKAMGQVYNIADTRYTTFRGLAQACATAAGRDARTLELVSYDPARVDSAHRKAFPLRQQHFFTSIEKALTDLDWRPQYDLAAGLKDSYENDYLAAGRDQKSVDFSVDEILLGA
ncbi:MAG: 3-beta hydroxysteroid dehydrogenase, partial [Gloeomargaritaceae cyanobacterium C42_A2020_066]|nr:3-beta hydroxysteroid dehydrogenase [Gloeomargaritaceae cyanobacterium C42_A2020_066]